MTTSNKRGMATTATALSLLPEEMETEVLLRMPVKSVLRLRTVCRRWAALLSSEEFCAAWTKLAEATTKDPAAQLMCLPLTLYDKSIEVLSGDGRLLLTLDAVRGCSTDMAPAPCRGLTFLHDPLLERYHVLNAATRATVTLLPPAYCKENRATFFPSSMGLGFDARIKEHKVVRLFNGAERSEDRFSRIKCELYTLGMGTGGRWRPPSSAAVDGIVPSMLAGAAVLTATFEHLAPVFAEGFLHWLVNPIYNILSHPTTATMSMNVAASTAILSFSVADDTFSSWVRPPPEPFNWADKGCAHLTELGGKLCMVRDLRRNSSLLEIWSYSNGADCWLLDHRINLAWKQYVGRDDLAEPLYVRIIGSSIGKRKVIFIATSRCKVVAYDPKSGTIETILQFGGETSRHETISSLTKVALFKESLTPLHY